MSHRPWRVVAVAKNRVVAVFRKLRRAVAHAFAIGGAIRHVSGAQWVSIEPQDVASFCRWIRDCLAVRRENLAAMRRAAAANAANLGMTPKAWRRFRESQPIGAVMMLACFPHRFQEFAP